MANTKAGDFLDVERSAVVRLIETAKQRCQQAEEAESFAAPWWQGYLRALEQVLEMEDE